MKQQQLPFPAILDAAKPDGSSVLLLGRGDPDRAFRHAQYLVQHDLHPSVPDSVRKYCDRITTLFAYGFFQYQFFTVAGQLAEMAYELPLGERFVEFCGGTVELRRYRPQDFAAVTVRNLGELTSLLHPRYGAYPHSLGWRVVDPSTRKVMPNWYTSAKERFRWAQRESLLPGQKPRVIFEEGTVSLRNSAAHPAGHWFGMPNDAAVAIADLAETINKLWGHDTPGGRLYPGPLERELMAPARGPDETIIFYRAQDIEEVPEDRQSWTFELILAASHEPIHEFDRAFEMTAYPAERIAGPCSWQEAVRIWRTTPETKRHDTVEYKDRLFVVGVLNDQPEVPRSPAAFHALDRTAAASRSWYLIKADLSYDARGHVMHELGLTGNGRPPVGVGPCTRCPTYTVVARGTQADVEGALH
jgi:hypothetical protein